MKRLLLAAWLLVAPGCASVITIGVPEVYTGTRADVELISEFEVMKKWPGQLVLLDLPLSFLLDTLLLPYKSAAWALDRH